MRTPLVVSFVILLVSLGACGFALEPGRPATRVVSLVPSQTEMLFALGFGGMVVGVTDLCNFPPEVKALPRIGGVELDLEKISALQPTLIVDLSGMHRRYELFFRQVGWNYRSYSLTKLGDIPKVAREMAADLEVPEAGERFASDWEKKLQLLPRRTGQPTRIYVEIWDSPPQGAGPTSFLGDLITLVGGRNVLVEDEAEFPVIRPEAIVQSDPEVILLAYPLSNLGKLSSRQGWSDITAIRNGNIFFINEDLFLRPGPRSLEAAEKLFQILLKAR